MIYSLAAIIVLFLVAFAYHAELFAILKWPIVRELEKANMAGRILQLDFMELFWIHLKLSLVAAIFVGSPFILYQVWLFIAPGLYPHERRHALPFVLGSTVCFIGGAVFCYFLILPILAQFVIALSKEDTSITLALRVDTVYSFPINLMLAFGICFELPVVMFFITWLGLVTPQKLIKFYRYFIVLSLVIGAILTPPDPTSQVALALPMNVLYWLGIATSYMAKRDKAEVAATAPET